MGIKKLEACTRNLFRDREQGRRRAFTESEIDSMFRAFAAPDAPPADGPKPRRMMDQHGEEHDECPDCRGVCVPVDAEPDRPAECEHEWDNATILLTAPPQIKCKKCGTTKYVGGGTPEDRPAPPTPEQLGDFEMTGEYRGPTGKEWHMGMDDGDYDRPIFGDCFHDPRWILRKKPAPWTPKRGDRVRYDHGPLKIEGTIWDIYTDGDGDKVVKLIGPLDNNLCLEDLELLEPSKE